MSAATIERRTVTVIDWGDRSAEMADTIEMSDRERIGEAFKVWRKLTGGRARGSFACCGSCGHAELSGMDDGERSFVFWHRQDDRAFSGDELTDSLWIKHDAQPEELELLVELLRMAHLVSSWTGDPGRCVEVKATRF